MAGFLFITIGGSKGTFDMTPSDACGKSEIMLADAYVTNVKWFKKTNMPFHEFLVVYVTTRPDPNLKETLTTVIAIDRNVDGIVTKPEEGSTTGRPDDSDLLFYGEDGKEIHPDPDALLLSPAPPIRASFSTSMESLKSSSSSSSSLRTRAAADQLHFSCNGTDDFLKEDKWVKSVLCRQLKIKVGYLTLAHVAVLARAVHDHHPNYKATQYQCYWYAEIIYTTIQRIVRDAVGPNARPPPFKESVSHPKRDVGQFWTERLGFFKVRRGVPKTPELVYQEYREDWATTEKTITEAMEQKKLKSLMDCAPEFEKEKAERIAAEEKLAKERTERIAAEEKGKAERIAAEEKFAKERAERIAAEEKERAERIAAQERVKTLEEQVARLMRPPAQANSTHRASVARSSS